MHVYDESRVPMANDIFRQVCPSVALGLSHKNDWTMIPFNSVSHISLLSFIASQIPELMGNEHEYQFCMLFMTGVIYYDVWDATYFAGSEELLFWKMIVTWFDKFIDVISTNIRHKIKYLQIFDKK